MCLSKQDYYLGFLKQHFRTWILSVIKHKGGKAPPLHLNRPSFVNVMLEKLKMVDEQCQKYSCVYFYILSL
jgi:hypothetical protein